MKKNLYKRKFLLIAGVLTFYFGTTNLIRAQSDLIFSPMSFKELLIDFRGETVVRSQVGIRVSLLHGVNMDSTVYVETHNKVTNNNGMVSFVIGEGTPEGSWDNSINFGDGPYFVKREYDFNDGTNYSVENISQMVSVPFALHAKVADTTFWAPYPWKASLPTDTSVLTTNGDGTYRWVEPALPFDGTEGDFLSVDTSGVIGWRSGLPSYPSETKVLGYDGTDYSWVSKVGLPTSGGSGKPYYALGTNGTALTQVGVDTILTASGTNGQILIYNGPNTKQEWVDYDWDLPDNYSSGDILSIDNSGNEIWIPNDGINKMSLGPDSTLGGEVFKLSEDSTHALVVAFRDLNVDTILGQSSKPDTISWYQAMDFVKDTLGYDEAGKAFSDWRLPTESEFNILKDKISLPMTPPSGASGWWTATQDDDYSAIPMELKAKGYSGIAFASFIKSKGMLVRPVRLVRYK